MLQSIYFSTGEIIGAAKCHFSSPISGQVFAILVRVPVVVYCSAC